jgi:outer membrane protein TolC
MDGVPAMIGSGLCERKDKPALINPKWCERLRPASPAAYFASALRFFVCATSAMIFVHALLAQSPAEMNPQPSSVVQLPLSGRAAQTGSVSVTQSTTNTGGGNSVNVIDSSVSATAPFNGSVPQGHVNPNEIQLTLEDALSLGLRFNLGAISQAQAVLQAKGQRLVARSGLLPNVNAAVSEEFEKLNLRTQGVESSTFPVTAEFNFFDARAARLNQTIFDLVKIENLHSASDTLRASLNSARNARDLIVLAVAGSYVQLIATQARISAAKAQVETSRAIYQQAADRFAAGLNARLDATRSKVQLQTEEQRLRSLQADLETQKLRLARILGFPLGQRFTVINQYPYTPLTGFTEETALKQAMESRSDLQSSAAGIEAAEHALKGARAERLPNLAVAGDFGAAGLRPTKDATSVYTASGTLTIPLFEGGRIHGDILQATAALQQRKAEYEDTRGQVDQDVRQAFINLNSAADQVDVARSNVDLAHETLDQSRDRFTQGVADTVELVQGEQAVVQADEDYITAVYEHNLAKVSLARAMGNAEQTLLQLLRK